MHEPLVQRIDASLDEAALSPGRINSPQAEVDGEVRRPEALRQLPQYRGLPGPLLPVEHETLAERPAGELAVDAVEEFLTAEEHLLLLDRGAARIPAVGGDDTNESAGLFEHGHHGPRAAFGDLAVCAPAPRARGHTE